MGYRSAAERDRRREAFGRALSEALKASGLTLDAVARRLEEAGARTSPATLSYWQNGQALPTRGRSREAVPVLEKILGVPMGHLGRFVTGETAWFPDEVTPATTLRRMVAELGLDLERRFSMLAANDALHIGPDRRSASEVVRQFMRVEGERETAVLLAVAEEAGPPPTVRAVHGCSAERSLTDEATGLRVVALDLPRTMHHGEQFWLEYAVDWQATQDDRDGNSRILAQITGLMSMDVVFEGEPPSRAWYSGDLAEDVADRSQEVPVVGNRLQMVLTDVPAGEHKLSWAW